MTVTAVSTKQFVEEYIAALGGVRKTEELIDRYVADLALKQHILDCDAGFPGYELLTDDVIAEGDVVAFRGKFHGTHNGVFAGIPPTGKEITEDVAVFYRVENQKIVKFWMVLDMTNVLNELRG